MSHATGYWLTAAGCGALLLVLLTHWRRRPGAAWLAFVAAITAVWAMAYGYSLGTALLPIGLLYALDVLRLGAWLALLGRLLVPLGFAGAPLMVMNGAWCTALGVLVAATLADPGSELALIAFQTAPGVALLCVVLGMLLIEQLYRNTLPAARRYIKHLCYAAGAVMAFDLYYYSDILWLQAGGLDLLGARGYVQFLSLPFLLLAADSGAQSRLELSHRTVFFTTAMTAVSVYLVLVSAGSFYVERYGGSWGRVAQLTFLAAAFLTLLALLFSDHVRAHFRVFVQKHFQRYKYDYRREWLRFTQTLSRAAGEEEILNISIHAMAEIVGSHGGVMWVAEEGSGIYRPAACVPAARSAASDVRGQDPLVAFLRERGWIVDLAEFEREPQRYAPLTLPAWLAREADAWLVIPLSLGNILTGFVVLDRVPAPPQLNFEDHDLLKTVGRDVAIHISQFEANRRLAENQQLGAYHRLSAFVMHDLKNLVAQLSLVVENAQRHKRNPEFIDDSILTIRNSVARMDRLIGQLSGRGEPSPEREPVSLRRVLLTAVERCGDREPSPLLLLDCDDTVMANAEELATVFEHLLRNAQDATGPAGSVRVTMRAATDTVHVYVCDDGCGMNLAFVRERLFRPFETTKGAAGLGIGVFQAKECVRRLDGDIVVTSEPGRGTTFEIVLPRRAHAERARA